MTFFQSDNPIQQVGTTRNKFAESFSGVAAAAGQPSLDALIARGWRVVRNTGMTPTLNNGSLAVNMGTTNGAELVLVGPSQQTIPANILGVFLMSQRIAGNEFRLGYVEVNPETGLPVAHPSIAGEFNNYAAFRCDATTATAATLETMADGIAIKRTMAVTGLASTAAAVEYSLEVRNEDVILSSQSADGVTARVGAGRLSSVVPNPNLSYAPFLWFRNVSAPASATTITLNRILALDIQELQAEIGGGRGNVAASQAIPVVVAASGTQTPVTVNGAVTVVASGTGVATNNNLSIARILSAATTNATLVKATAGRISAGIIANASASWRWFKLYNRTTAPTVGTDVPVLTIGLAPNSTTDLGAVLDIYGVFFPTGIAYAITGGVADADTTAIGANEVAGGLLFG